MARIAGIDLPKKQKRCNWINIHLWYRKKYFTKDFEGQQY